MTTPTFVFFPYWKTSKPVFFQGITFRDVSDAAGLEPISAGHVRTLAAMFFLRHNLQIERLTYAIVDSESTDTLKHMVERIECFQILWSYLYSRPDERMGDTLQPTEHGTCYRFSVTDVPTSLISDLPNTRCISVDPGAHEGHFVTGYLGVADHCKGFFVIPGCRIYPPSLDLYLHNRQDLSENEERMRNGPYAELLHFFEKTSLTDRLARRLTTALRWYNRASAGHGHADVQLVHLAIAFEALFGLPRNEKVTERFKDAVKLLIGPIPRLNSFLTQFYTVRSALMHDGYATDVMFRAADLPEGGQFNEKDLAKARRHRSLLMYGRHIFRMCVPSMVHGYLAARKIDLGSLFRTNEERFEQICKLFNDVTSEPRDSLSEAARIGSVVSATRFSEENKPPLGQLIAVAKGAALTFNKLHIPVSPEATTAIAALASLSGGATELAQMEAVDAAVDALRYMPSGGNSLTAVNYLLVVLECVWEYVNLQLIYARHSAQRAKRDTAASAGEPS